MYYYTNYFFLFSILGHFIEGFFYTDGQSGILQGYWTPIYGLGVIAIISVYRAIEQFINQNKIKKLISVFLIGAILISILEYIGGIVIETLFHMVFWDYSNMKFNIGKYTSLEMAMIWGISSIFLIYFVKPLLDKIIKKIPKWITWVFMILFFIDVLFLVIKI